MGVNNKNNGVIDDIFNDDFEVTYDEATYDEETYNKETFDENFEVTYEEETVLGGTELNMDAYKDVLSVLNELDETGSMDYLEANRTRTIDLGNYFESTGSLKTEKKEEDPHAKHRGLSSYFSDIFKKHE